ncbi:glycosyltransferase 61 family protein [Gluconobacter kondonii]|uniref:glycosyltransferase 61 family protein n=1 Tax=Gluconobacter kondonii TaxID=941463 RepID=UPI001B8C91C0|nr:glycosyltransferase 61 family protein [Gluconobacter kondonii]MBS1054998.1 DUF563 domain-containing protein [Gluconobacter kondonii]
MRKLELNDFFSRNNLRGRSFYLKNMEEGTSLNEIIFGMSGLIEVIDHPDKKYWNEHHGSIILMDEEGSITWKSIEIRENNGIVDEMIFSNFIYPEKEIHLVSSERKNKEIETKEKVILLKTNYNVRALIPRLISMYDVVEVETLDEAFEHGDAKIFLSALVLTHMEEQEQVVGFLEKICKFFPISMFVEPSSYTKAYLDSLGYKSHHDNYAENHLLDKININFLSEIGKNIGVYRVEHYGGESAFDIRVPWIVPRSWPHNIDYSELVHRKNYTFDRPVFEMSYFVLKGFNAPVFTPDVDLELIELQTIQPHAKAGALLFNGFRSASDLGKELYKTPLDRSELLEGRTIHSAIVIDEVGVYAEPERQEILRKWRDLCKSEWLDLSVNELPHCIVGGSGFIFSDGSPVGGSEYLIPYLYTSMSQPIWFGLQRPHLKRHIPGISIVGFNHLYDNYYHFMAEALSSAILCYDILSKKGFDKISIITGKTNAFRREYFDIIFGKNKNIEIIELDRDEYVTTDNTLYCSQLVGRSTPQPCLIAERVSLQARILEEIGLFSVAPPTRLVYISRQDTGARPILNEAELIACLQGFGFEIYVATGRSVSEQIEVFRTAKLVVAGHGAGVSNMFFAQNDTTLIELIQASYLNVGPLRLAQISGVKYHSMLFFNDGENNGWYVDIERVKNIIKDFID